MRGLLVGFAVVFLLAGCLQVGGPGKGPTPSVNVPTDTQWAATALEPDTNGHNHRDWREHLNMSTPNFVELAHDPLGIPAFGNKTAGGYFCGGAATTTDGRHITVISSYDTSVAFVLVDTTDPAHPIHLGDYVLNNAQTYDVDITPDGKHVVVAADVSPQKQPDPPLAAADGQKVLAHWTFRDACDGQTYVGPEEMIADGPSTILVSIANPRTPTFEDVVPAPVIGPHSVSTAVINGITYVASSTTNLEHQGSYYQFFHIQTLPTDTRLIQDSVVDAGQYGDYAHGNNVQGQQVPATLINGHIDAEISMHPITHKPVVYLSDWDGGLVVLDFSTPQAPVMIGSWHDTGADGGALHSTRSVDGVYNGHHYLIAGQEFTGRPSNRPSGWIYILDDTDPANIKEVGRWTLPIDTQAKWGGVELFSTHYFRLEGDTLFAAMYHGGIWAVKLDFEHPENMKEPKSIGVFVPDGGPQNGREPKGGYDYAPFVLDVFPYGNDLVIYDGLSGVYSVRYDPAHPMPAPDPWPAAGKAHAP